MKTIDQPHPKKPASASSTRQETNPQESSAELPAPVSSPPQPPATSEEQLEEVNKELQRLAAATQLQTQQHRLSPENQQNQTKHLNNMTTHTVTTNKADNTCVSELIQPLAEALQKLTQHPRDEIEVAPFSTFEGQDTRSHEAYIAFDLHAETPNELLRALQTIFEKTGSWLRWLNFAGPDERNRYDGPLMFAIVQQRYGSEYLHCHSYLWVYSREEDFDAAAARRQISNLVELIGDSNNLVELAPQLRMRL